MVHFQYPGRSRVSLRHSGPGFGRLPSRPVPPGCGARPSHPGCTPGSTGFPQPRPQDDLQHRLPSPGDCPRAIRGQQKCGVPPVRHQPLDPALVAGPPGPLTEPGRPPPPQAGPPCVRAARLRASRRPPAGAGGPLQGERRLHPARPRADGGDPEKKQTRYRERESASRIKYLSDLRQSLKQRPGRAVYLDETGFERTAHRPYAWAPRGRKVFGERSGRSRPRTNLIAATAKGKRLFAPLLFEGSLDSSVFNHYLKEQLLKELKPGSLIIMDNAAFHKTQKTRGILEESGHELIFLPPYSPDFNPIEKHFANLKKIRTCQPQDTSIDDIVRLYGF